MPRPLPPSPTPAQCAFLRGDATRAPQERAPSGLPSPWRRSKTHKRTPRKPDFFFFKKKKTNEQTNKKSNKELRAEKQAVWACGSSTRPRSSAVRLVIQARPAQRWEPASPWSPTARAQGASAQSRPGAPMAHEGA